MNPGRKKFTDHLSATAEGLLAEAEKFKGPNLSELADNIKKTASEIGTTIEQKVDALNKEFALGEHQAQKQEFCNALFAPGNLYISALDRKKFQAFQLIKDKMKEGFVNQAEFSTKDLYIGITRGQGYPGRLQGMSQIIAFEYEKKFPNAKSEDITVDVAKMKRLFGESWTLKGDTSGDGTKKDTLLLQ